jgi:hypothetical protein
MYSLNENYENDLEEFQEILNSFRYKKGYEYEKPKNLGNQVISGLIAPGAGSPLPVLLFAIIFSGIMIYLKIRKIVKDK